MNETIWGMAGLTLMPVVLLAVVAWFSARTRQGVLFGVSVPVEFAGSAEARRRVGRFRAVVVGLGAVCAAGCLPWVLRAAPWVVIVVVPLLMVGVTGMWVRERLAVRGHRVAVAVERSAGLGDEGGGVGWLVGLGAAGVPLVGCWGYLRAHFDEIPARYAEHWNAAGVANGWGTRSAKSVAMPLVLGGAIVVFMLGMGIWTRLAPSVGRARMVKVALPLLAVVGWALSGMFCVVGLLPLIEARLHGGVGVTLAAVMAGVLVVLGAVMWGMSRLMTLEGGERYDGTPDAGWKAGGMVYYNPADGAVFVPKRFGWGWTVNMARGATWVYLGATLGFVGVVLGIVFWMRRRGFVEGGLRPYHRG